MKQLNHQDTKAQRKISTARSGVSADRRIFEHFLSGFLPKTTTPVWLKFKNFRFVTWRLCG